MHLLRRGAFTLPLTLLACASVPSDPTAVDDAALTPAPIPIFEVRAVSEGAAFIDTSLGFERLDVASGARQVLGPRPAVGSPLLLAPGLLAYATLLENTQDCVKLAPALRDKCWAIRLGSPTSPSIAVGTPPGVVVDPPESITTTGNGRYVVLVAPDSQAPTPRPRHMLVLDRMTGAVSDTVLPAGYLFSSVPGPSGTKLLLSDDVESHVFDAATLGLGPNLGPSVVLASWDGATALTRTFAPNATLSIGVIDTNTGKRTPQVTAARLEYEMFPVPGGDFLTIETVDLPPAPGQAVALREMQLQRRSRSGAPPTVVHHQAIGVFAPAGSWKVRHIEEVGGALYGLVQVTGGFAPRVVSVRLDGAAAAVTRPGHLADAWNGTALVDGSLLAIPTLGDLGPSVGEPESLRASIINGAGTAAFGTRAAFAPEGVVLWSSVGATKTLELTVAGDSDVELHRVPGSPKVLAVTSPIFQPKLYIVTP